MNKIKKFNEYVNNNDYDVIDADEKDYLYILTSEIPNSGKGLFTAIDIWKGEIVSKFKGEVLSDEEAQKRVDNNEDQYFMSLPSGEMFDTKKTNCFAKYANDAEGIPSEFKNNTFIAMDDEDNIVLVSKRDIKKGSEIFTGYGKEYWKKYKE